MTVFRYMLSEDGGRIYICVRPDMYIVIKCMYIIVWNGRYRDICSWLFMAFPCVPWKHHGCLYNSKNFLSAGYHGQF